MEDERKAGTDESFKRPGSIPFKWEIQPGIPKPQRHDGVHTHTSPPPQKPLPKLSPPPSYASNIGEQVRRDYIPCQRASPISQGCFPIQHRRRKEANLTSSPSTSLHRSNSAQFLSLFSSSSSSSSSRAKEELDLVAQWLFYNS